MDMTPGPDFEIDEAHESIDMVVKIDQQAQYVERYQSAIYPKLRPTRHGNPQADWTH